MAPRLAPPRYNETPFFPPRNSVNRIHVRAFSMPLRRIYCVAGAFLSPFFPDVRTDPLSIASPLVNTSSANSFPAAFRPSLPLPHPPPPSRFYRPISLPLPTHSSFLTLSRACKLSLSHFSPTPTRRHRVHISPDTCVYITLCTGARWSTYLWLIYEIHALPAAHIHGVPRHGRTPRCRRRK